LAAERSSESATAAVRGGPPANRLVRRRLAPTTATAASGGSHHAATPTVCSSQVTTRAAATVAATVQSSPMMKRYQNLPNPWSQARITVPPRLSQATIMVHLAFWGTRWPACRRRRSMYPAAATTYHPTRARIAASPPGHATPSPSTAQKVPKLDSSVPTRSCRALRGIRSTIPRASSPAPTMTPEAAAAEDRGGKCLRGRAEADDDQRDFEALEQHTLERQDERGPVHAMAGDAVGGRGPRAHAAETVGADSADPLAEPLQAEHQEQRADRKPQRADRHERQRRAERQDEHREDGQAGSGAKPGRPPAANGADADHDDHHLDDLDGRRQERGDEDGGVALRDVSARAARRSSPLGLAAGTRPAGVSWPGTCTSPPKPHRASGHWSAGSGPAAPVVAGRGAAG